MTILPHIGLDTLSFGANRAAILDKFGHPLSEHVVGPGTPHAFLSIKYGEQIGLAFHVYNDFGLQTISVFSSARDAVFLSRRPMHLCSQSDEPIAQIKKMINEAGYEFREDCLSMVGHIVAIPELRTSFHFSFPDELELLSFIQICGPSVGFWFETGNQRQSSRIG